MKTSAIIIASLVLLVGAGLFVMQSPIASANTVVVYKSPTCGCCSSWIEHMEAAGFTGEVHDTQNMNEIKIQNGVSRPLASCHTAIVNGYVIEGHVPAEDVTRLLAELPDIKGLAVPGMPIGSPGMGQGMPSDYQAYDVIAFDAAGRGSVYRSVPGGVNSR